MSVFVDHDRLLLGVARTLRQRLLPHLNDDSARFSALMANEMIVNMVQRRAGVPPPPDLAAAQEMVNEIRQLTQGAVDKAAGERLVSLLEKDADFYKKDKAAHGERLAAESALREEVFDAPSDDKLTSVLRILYKDDTLEARLSGRAVGGYSKQTLFIDVLRNDEVQQRLVMRRDLPFATSDRSSVVIEYPVLKALFARGYVVAEPLFLETDPTVLSSPFLISRRMPGRIYGTPLGLQEEVDFDSEDLLGKLLADLHRIDVDSLDLDPLPGSATDLASQVARIDGFIEIYRSHIDVPSAVLEIALAWLRANAGLVSGRSSLVHGDVGLHNILIDSGQVTALVDWELIHVANPVEDVAYVASYISQPDVLIANYVKHGGIQPSEAEMTYCLMFGNVRNSIYGLVAMALFNRGASDDVSVLPIVLNTYWTYIEKIERRLTAAIKDHGFTWSPA